MWRNRSGVTCAIEQLKQSVSVVSNGVSGEGSTSSNFSATIGIAQGQADEALAAATAIFGAFAIALAR